MKMHPDEFISGLAMDGSQQTPEPEESNNAGGFLLFLGILSVITLLGIFSDREDLGL